MQIDIEDLKRLSKSRLYGGLKRIKFTGVSIDSRSCKKGDLFFAIKGEIHDGHEYLKNAFARGVNGAVVNHRWYSKLSSAQKELFEKYLIIVVDNTVKSLGELASIYRSRFLVPVIAVGGSNGKTTAKEFIAGVLSKKFKVLKTEGNFNNQFGVPLTLFRLSKLHDVCVIETGANHFGEIDNLCRIAKPQFGVITNIGKEHLEFFGNLSGVAKAECEMIDYLYSNYGTFFLNKSDKVLAEKINKTGIKHFSFSSNKNADVRGKVKSFIGFNPVIEIKFGKEKFTVKLKSIGAQSFEAAVCASAIGFYFGLSAALIKEALEELNLRKNKRNELKIKNGLYVIDDTYNSNPDSVKMALENLKKFSVRGRRHIVLADMLELGKSSGKEHKGSGKLVKKLGLENLYTYGTEAYNIFRGAKGIKNNFYFTDKQTLIEFLKLNVKSGDLILVKGSRAMKMEEVVEAI